MGDGSEKANDWNDFFKNGNEHSYSESVQRFSVNDNDSNGPHMVVNRTISMPNPDQNKGGQLLIKMHYDSADDPNSKW